MDPPLVTGLVFRGLGSFWVHLLGPQTDLALVTGLVFEYQTTLIWF